MNTRKIVKFGIALFVLLLVGPVQAQQHPVKITFDAPKGWRGETITLPPGFAKDLSLKGMEEIRFAPGMFKADKEDFFSYVLVFWLPETKPLSKQQIQDELLKYYRGLATAVGKGRKLKIDTAVFKIDVKPVKEKPGEFVAVMDWVEPFVTGKPQKLHMELKAATMEDGKASTLQMTVSPQPTDHQVWKSLRKVLASVKITPIRARRSIDGVSTWTSSALPVKSW